MQTLFLIDPGFGFDPAELRERCLSIPGVSEFLGRGESLPLTLDYTHAGGDWVTVRLSQDLKALFIDGKGDAAMAFVLLMLQLYGRSFRLTNDDYSFDEEVSSATTMEDLRAWLEDDPAGEAAPSPATDAPPSLDETVEHAEDDKGA